MTDIFFSFINNCKKLKDIQKYFPISTFLLPEFFCQFCHIYFPNLSILLPFCQFQRKFWIQPKRNTFRTILLTKFNLEFHCYIKACLEIIRKILSKGKYTHLSNKNQTMLQPTTNPDAMSVTEKEHFFDFTEFNKFQ